MRRNLFPFRLVELQKATAFMMPGDKVSAAEAEQAGMIYKCFEDNIFEESAARIAGTLARLPAQALLLTRNALLQFFPNSLETTAATGDSITSPGRTHPDLREGITAFFRTPNALRVIRSAFRIQLTKLPPSPQ